MWTTILPQNSCYTENLATFCQAANQYWNILGSKT